MPPLTKPFASRLARSTSSFVLAALAVASAPTVATAATQARSSITRARVDDEDAAFAALLSARSDARRRTLAEAYLRDHGNDAPVSRQATAHALLGAALWRASCPGAVDGLCVEVQPAMLADDVCLPPLRDRLVPRARSPKLAAAARDHLEQASWLMDVPRPADPAEARAFQDAIAETLVLLADHDLEDMLGLEPPPGPHSVPTPPDTAQALSDYASRLLGDAAALIQAYAEVKTTLSARWTMVAAARTGLVMETPPEAFAAIAIPTGLDDESETAYCEELSGPLDTMRQRAQEVYAWCVDRADTYGLDGPAVETCRERLDVLEEAAQ